MTGLHGPRETADRAGEHKASLKSQKYLKEVGCVSSIHGESGGLGRRPNEGAKNNLIDKKSNMPNYKNTMVEKAILILCKGIQFTSCGSCFSSPKSAEWEETILKLGPCPVWPSWLGIIPQSERSWV